jgi:hypothetical protein
LVLRCLRVTQQAGSRGPGDLLPEQKARRNASQSQTHGSHRQYAEVPLATYSALHQDKPRKDGNA